MAINKNALLRYKILDKCFRNFGRRYYIEHLLTEINNALLEENPNSTGIQIRQLRDDIRVMKSEAGFNAPIEAIRDGKKTFYVYADKEFSINNSPLNETEIEQLKNAISLLRKFEGRQEFEFLNELGPILNDRIGKMEQSQPIIGFDSNLDYAGNNHIPEIFNAIINKRVIELTYKPFTGASYIVNCHPYYLKQYNNRWFLFGRNEQLNHNQWNFPLDRIESIKELNLEYQKDETNWEDYFYDIIGVTRTVNDLQEVILEFSQEQISYIQTKPLHPSQKTKMQDSGKMQVSISVIPNFELESLILSFGEKAKVISPEYLSVKIYGRMLNAANQYE
jgi:predicted DNA-binding transcriptional regulator YafY